MSSLGESNVTLGELKSFIFQKYLWRCPRLVLLLVNEYSCEYSKQVNEYLKEIPLASE